MHNHIHDIATILSSTGSLLAAAVPPVNSSRPVIKNTTSESAKPEITAPEIYVAPGAQYANAREALAHLIHQLHNPVRDSYNETLDFTYAKLPALLDMLRDPIYQHGLMLNQELKIGTNGLPFDMVTTFHHIPTATEVSFSLPAYIKEDKRLDDCQRVGASYTYFRRYGLRQALDITDGDDDADQAEAKRERRGKKSGPTARPDALHDELMTCLPDVTAPGWEEAERKAVAMGATPYTPEQIEAAKDQKRAFAKLAPIEVAFINAACDDLAGDFSGITPLFKKYETALNNRIAARDVLILDEEDLRRGYHRCWLQAAQEFTNNPVSPLCVDDECDVIAASVDTVAISDDISPEELARISEKRAARLAALRSGNLDNSTGNPEEDAEYDALYEQVKSGLSPQIPLKQPEPEVPEKTGIDIPESELPY